MSLHCNAANSFLFAISVKIHQFKAQDSETKPYLLWNISKDFTVDNMKETGSRGKVYNFSVSYETVDTSDIIDIHKY